jgi:hypothetical protein
MKRSVLTALAFAAAGIAGAASADTRAYVTVQTPQPIYVQPEYRWGPPQYAFDSSEYDHVRHHRHGCRAARWDPNARYMPGQAVWRNGQVYVATEVSRNVYNVNSPPEWTPNYWAPANCG